MQIKNAFKFQDHRGDLVVFLQPKDLPENKMIFGQIYFVTFANKNIVRGNHYHKNWHEWFGIITGTLEVVLEDVQTKQRRQFIISGDDHQYQRLYILPNIAHAFRCLSDHAALLNYSDKEWNPRDTFPYELIPEKKS